MLFWNFPSSQQSHHPCLEFSTRIPDLYFCWEGCPSHPPRLTSFLICCSPSSSCHGLMMGFIPDDRWSNLGVGRIFGQMLRILQEVLRKTDHWIVLKPNKNKTLKVSSLVLIWQIVFAELADVMSFSTVCRSMKPSNQKVLRPKASSATTSGVSSLPVLLARNLCCFNLLPNPNPTRTEFHYWLWVQKPLLWDLLGGSLSILHGLWPLMGQWQGKGEIVSEIKKNKGVAERFQSFLAHI